MLLHFIQKYSQTSSKMLRFPFSVGLGASRKIEKLFFKTSLQKDYSPLLRRPWHLSFPVCVSKTHCYHTSPCCFKKKQKQAELTARSPSTITYLSDSPKPALFLTLAGLGPIVATPLIMVMTKTYIPELAFIQVAYGTGLLSFIGGIRWGFALPENSPAKPDYLNLASSMVPVMFSWFAFLISERINEAIVIVITGLGITLHIELFLLPHYPNWFKALRIVVTLVAFFSFVITLLLQDIYPEKELKKLGQVE